MNYSILRWHLIRIFEGVSDDRLLGKVYKKLSLLPHPHPSRLPFAPCLLGEPGKSNLHVCEHRHSPFVLPQGCFTLVEPWMVASVSASPPPFAAKSFCFLRVVLLLHLSSTLLHHSGICPTQYSSVV